MDKLIFGFESDSTPIFIFSKNWSDILSLGDTRDKITKLLFAICSVQLGGYKNEKLSDLYICQYSRWLKSKGKLFCAWIDI